jgi:hypothetical protein
MEVLEWVRVVSHGTCEELREFIRANPGFDWDRTAFNGRSAFVIVLERNPFPLQHVQILHDFGGARFNVPINKGSRTPLEIVAFHGMTDMAALLIGFDVPINTPRVLEHHSEVREMILDHSMTLTRKIVNRALEHMDQNTVWHWQRRLGPYNNSVRNSLNRWLVSHNYRRDASLCVAWTLSQLTGTLWPDMREQLLERLMASRVREW